MRRLDLRRSRPALALAVAVALTAGIIGGLSRAHVETSLTSFLPVDDPVLAGYGEIADRFGGDPVVVLLETEDGSPYLSADRVPATLKLEGSLVGVERVTGVYGPATLLNQIAGRAQDLLAELLGRRDAEVALARAQAQRAGGDRAAVIAAGERALTAFDTRYGPLLVSGMPGGLPTLENQRFIDNVVLGSAGRPRGQWRFVVPTVSSAAIVVRPDSSLSAQDAAALTADVRRVVEKDLPPGVRVTVSGTPVLLTALSDRTADDAAKLGTLAVLAVGLCFLFATFLRRSRRLAPLGTTLVAVAGAVSIMGWTGRPISVGIVAFCSVLLGIGCYYPTYFILGARPRTVLVVAAATTASLATLGLSPLPLVRDLGLTMAIGVALAVGLALPLRSWLSAPAAAASRPGRTPDRVPPPPTRTSPRTMRVALALASGLAVIGWFQLPSLAVETDVDQFAGGLPALDDARHVEDVLGSSGEVSIVLRGPDTLTPRALEWQQSALRSVIATHGGDLKPVLSVGTLLEFLGDRPTPEQVDAAMRILPEYLTRAVVTADRSTATMSFGVSIDDLTELDVALEDAVANLPPPPVGYDVDVTGLPVVLLRSEDLVSEDRVPANVWGILAAGVVLLLGLRRRGDALRAVGAAVVATGLSFFVVFVADIALNPVTVALGALTAAVGCEFTVVQAEAVRRRSRVLSRAVALVAVTSTVGYLVLLASGLEAVRSFGLLLAGAVGLAALGSWLVVGATLATPADETSSPPTDGDELTADDTDSRTEGDLHVTHA